MTGGGLMGMDDPLDSGPLEPMFFIRRGGRFGRSARFKNRAATPST